MYFASFVIWLSNLSCTYHVVFYQVQEQVHGMANMYFTVSPLRDIYLVNSNLFLLVIFSHSLSSPLRQPCNSNLLGHPVLVQLKISVDPSSSERLLVHNEEISHQGIQTHFKSTDLLLLSFICALASLLVFPKVSTTPSIDIFELRICQRLAFPKVYSLLKEPFRCQKRRCFGCLWNLFGQI